MLYDVRNETLPKEELEAQKVEQASQDQNKVKAISEKWLSAMKSGQITGTRKRAVSTSTYKNGRICGKVMLMPATAHLMDQTVALPEP
jgi:hypothetical protein